MTLTAFMQLQFAGLFNKIYSKVSNTRRTKSQNLKDSRTVLRLSLPNPLKPDVKSRMKMYISVIDNFIAY